MNFLKYISEFINKNFKKYGPRILITVVFLVVLNFLLYLVKNKIVILVVNLIISLIIGLIIYRHNKEFEINDYILNVFLSGYLYTGNYVDEDVYNYSENVLLDYLGSHNNINKINSFLDPAIREINSWLIPNNTSLSEEVFAFINRNDTVTKYVKEFIYSYLFVGDEENYWRALANGITIYVQDFKKIKDDAIKSIVIFDGINILVSMVFFFIINALLKNYIFIVNLMIAILFYKLLKSTLFIFLQKKTLLDRYITSTEEAIINHNLSLIMAKRSNAFLELILNID